MSYSRPRRAGNAIPVRFVPNTAAARRAIARAKRSCCDDCTCAGCPDCVSASTRRMGMGNWLDDAIEAASRTFEPQSECIQQANLQTASLDMKTTGLALTWNPTGLYKPSDMSAILQQTLALLNAAFETVSTAPLSADDSTQMIMEAVDEIQRKIASSARFGAATGASDYTTQIDAPDFKDWVIKSMLTASAALATASVMTCNMSWLESAVAALARFIDGVIAVASRVGGAIFDIGKQVLNIPRDLSDLLDKALKVGIVAGGAYLAYLIFYKKKSPT